MEDEGAVEVKVLTRHRVSDFVRHGAVAVEFDEPVWNALKAMVVHRIHGVAVMEDSEVVGVFEEDDLVRALRALQGEALEAEARRFMKPAVVVNSSDTLKCAMIEMLRGGTTRALVRSSGLFRSQVYGIIAASDIVRVLAGDYRGPKVPNDVDQPIPNVNFSKLVGDVVVAQVVRNAPLTLDASISVADVARRMSERGRRYAVLLHDGTPIGRLGDWDLMGAALDAVLSGTSLHDLAAETYARTMVIVPSETYLHEALWEAVDKMSDRIYVAEDGKLIGVIPLMDAVYTLVKIASGNG